MAKNLEKRKRVMQRSMRLGHCVCDPKKPCPCPLFIEKDICTCAGERLEIDTGPVSLTRLLDNPGCASKIDQAALRTVLDGLPQSVDDPRVLIGVPAGDDAGVYKISDDLALVQTVDVFTPSVDDPYVFGQIAASNSLSDVYAMGGTPISALSVIGFPIHQLDDMIMQNILRGGIDKMKEAGVPVIGGHSINDNQIKAGFAVTGTVNPGKITTKSAARPGDVLILTKPIGTGIITFAAQIGRAPEGAVEAVAHSMTALNKVASELMTEFGANACTDITGFGLMGHLGEMAESSGVDVEIVWDDIPVFPGIPYCLANGIIPGGVERNRESSAHYAVLGEGVSMLMLELCFDPQTSGGLLIVLPAEKADALIDRLHDAGTDDAAIVGRVIDKGQGRVALKTNGSRQIPEPQETEPKPKTASVSMQKEKKEVSRMTPENNEEECCAPESDTSQPEKVLGPEGVLKSFKAFMQKANAPGALDVTTKQAVAVALSLLARCGPCAKSHINKAKSMGFTQQEIDELANQAISFGGSVVMMFYKELKL